MLCRWILYFWDTLVRNWTKPFQLKDPKEERTMLMPYALGPSPEHLNPAAPCPRCGSQLHTAICDSTSKEHDHSMRLTAQTDFQDKVRCFSVAFREGRRKEHSVLVKMLACHLCCQDLFGFVSLLHSAFSHNLCFGLLWHMKQDSHAYIFSPSTLWAAWWEDVRHI